MPTNDKSTPGGRLTPPANQVFEIPDPAVRESAALSLLAAVVLRQALSVALGNDVNQQVVDLFPDVCEALVAETDEAHHLATLVGGDPALLIERARRHIDAGVGALLVGAPWAAVAPAVEPVGAVG